MQTIHMKWQNLFSLKNIKKKKKKKKKKTCFRISSAAVMIGTLNVTTYTILHDA